ncbi:hypothetical protein ABFX02_10G121100 [Erythranthe guttata]
MSDVPSVLFHEILRRLPAESLLRCRAVCKGWRRLIDHPSFIRTHASNQSSSTTLLIRNSIGTRFCSLTLDSLNYEDAEQTIDVTPVKAVYCTGVPRATALPVPSCNGLILNSHYRTNKTWVIWNPLTRTFHELPEPDIETGLMGSGIGYDSASDDYKVVRIDRLFRHGKSVYQTSVYSLKMESWRIIKDCPYDISWVGPTRGIFLGGAIHWLSLHDIIIALDLETEEYREFSMPVLPPNSKELFETRLDVLGGCLVMSFYYLIPRMEGWMMKDYGDEKSWVKLFSFGGIGSIGIRLKPLAYFKNKGRVFMQRDEEFFWLDIKNNSAKKVVIHGLPDDFTSQIMPGSLFRLDESCAAAVKITAGMKRKRKTTKNKADARVEHSVSITDIRSRVEHSVSITDIPSRSDSTSKANWSSNY